MDQADIFDVAAVTAVTGELLAHKQAAERDGRLAEPAVTALTRAGLLKLWRPRALGGYELSPLDYARVAEQVARVDSAAAWLMMANANTTFDLRLAEADFVSEVFANPDVILCETFNRPMTGHAVAGGYRVSGRTPFASGCRHAHWIGHTALIGEAFVLMFHPAGALKIEDDWHTLGMRGSASNSILADDLFVPRHRVIDFTAGPARNRYFDSAPLYRMPEGILTSTFPPVSLGLLASALDSVSETARHKQPFASTTTLNARPLAQFHFGRAMADYRAARAYFHATIESAYQRAVDGQAFALTDKADLFLACTHALQAAADATRELARAAGTSAIHQGDDVERALRDTQVIAQHAFGAEGRFATVAQAYWGVEVDFPLLAMD